MTKEQLYGLLMIVGLIVVFKFLRAIVSLALVAFAIYLEYWIFRTVGDSTTRWILAGTVALVAYSLVKTTNSRGTADKTKSSGSGRPVPMFKTCTGCGGSGRVPCFHVGSGNCYSCYGSGMKTCSLCGGGGYS